MQKIKEILLCTFFLILFSCTHKQVQKSLPFNSRHVEMYDLDILCYNIHHANPPSRAGYIDIEAIGKVIRDQTPDLVALQEVDVKTNRSGNTLDQAATLAKLSGLTYHYFGKAINHDGGEYGVAILSKYPMEDMRTWQLPTAVETKGEPRVLAAAVIVLPGNKRILFASTHLDAQRADTNRLMQIRKITELLEHEKMPIIIAGDFNATPETRIIKHLDGFFKRTCIADCGFTIPVNIPNKTIDFIAYRPADSFTVKEHKVIDEKYASDHLPVKAIVELKY